MVLRLIDLMNLILILSFLISIQGRKPLCDFIIKKFHIDLYSDIYRLICFNLLIETVTLHFNYSLDDHDLHSRSQLCEKSAISVPIFLQNSQSIWMKFSLLPQPVGLLKLMLNLFRVIFKEEISRCLSL